MKTRVLGLSRQREIRGGRVLLFSGNNSVCVTPGSVWRAVRIGLGADAPKTAEAEALRLAEFIRVRTGWPGDRG
jgi:hypothetical protein